MTRLVIASVGLWLSACIIDAPVSGGGGMAPARSPMRPSTPSGPVAVKVGALLGDDKVEIQGAQFHPPQLVAGEQMKITLFFRVIDTIPDDYIVFVHIEDVDGKAERMNIDHRPMGGNYPTNQWKKGEVVRDEFGVVIPSGIPIRGVKIYAGLWDPKSDRRMKLMNPTAVANDGADRVLLATVPVLQ
jgi:hypothetical protein